MYTFSSTGISVWFGENDLFTLNWIHKAKFSILSMLLPSLKSRWILAIMGKIVNLSRSLAILLLFWQAVQTVKNISRWFSPWRKMYLCHTFWRRQWHPTPVLLPGKSHGQRSLVGCSPWGRWESDTTEWLHFHFSLSCTGEGNGNPLQCSCLENPRDRGAWWAAVYRAAQSWTRLKRLNSSSSSHTFGWINSLRKHYSILGAFRNSQQFFPHKCFY